MGFENRLATLFSEESEKAPRFKVLLRASDSRVGDRARDGVRSKAEPPLQASVESQISFCRRANQDPSGIFVSLSDT